MEIITNYNNEYKRKSIKGKEKNKSSTTTKMKKNE